MSDLTELTPHELMGVYESKNRKFKLASIVFGAVCVVGIIVLLLIGLSTLQGVNDQLASQKRLLNSQNQILSKIKTSADDRTQQINDLQQHIDCIVALFQQPNRAQLKITDLKNCKLANTGTSGGSAGSTKSQHNPGVSQPPTTSTPPRQTTTDEPEHPLICTLTLHLLGCNKKS